MAKSLYACGSADSLCQESPSKSKKKLTRTAPAAATTHGASGSVDASATMTLRTGDVNADGVVGTADLKEIRTNVGRGLVTEDNFRDDITVDGKVNHGDTTLEKSKL